MVAFKQPNSLRNLLVRAEISKPNTTIGKSHSCGDKRCKCCRHMQHLSSYTSKVTGKQYKICCTVNCKSANIIYILDCCVCGLQYIGESKQPFHKRLNGHRNDITNQRLPGACNRSPGSKLLSIKTQLHCGGHLGGRTRLPDTFWKRTIQ